MDDEYYDELSRIEDYALNAYDNIYDIADKLHKEVKDMANKYGCDLTDILGDLQNQDDAWVLYYLAFHDME